KARRGPPRCFRQPGVAASEKHQRVVRLGATVHREHPPDHDPMIAAFHNLVDSAAKGRLASFQTRPPSPCHKMNLWPRRLLPPACEIGRQRLLILTKNVDRKPLC